MVLDIIMLLIYIILNVYIIWRIGMWIDYSFSFHVKVNNVLKWSIAIVCVITSSTLLIWQLFPKGKLSYFLLKVGDYWLGFFIEIILALIVSDLILLILWLKHKKKRHEYSPLFHKIYGGVVLAAALFLTLNGFFSARDIKTNTYNITVEKKAGDPEQLKVALLGDLHMGYSIGCKQIEEMVEKCNATQPDVIMIAGDIFDNNYDALDDPEKLKDLLRQLKAKYGVYAVYGNHDVQAKLIGGFTVGGSRLRDPRMQQFLEESNVTVLVDDVVTIADDSIYLVGREDGEHTANKEKRKDLDQLVEGLDPNKTLFVMNHEPVGFEEYEDNHVDVLFSGHTHDGQFFPLTLMNLVAWKNSHGCKQFGDMYSVVTSGVGVYGPFMRTFTEAEVMEVNINFK